MDPFDVASLFALRALCKGSGQDTRPSIDLLTQVKPRTALAILPGSFNPPTAAHVLLAERALGEGYDAALFLWARNTAGKTPGGLIPEDRILSVRAAANGGRTGVGVASHGLYADQAEAAERAFPGAELGFLVGSDKVIQIFDDDWYDDRGATLDRLFSRARLICAPRSDQGEQLKWVLQSRANRRWADRIDILRLHPAVSDLSSTRVRGLLRAGADPLGLVPAGVGEILHQVRAFMPPLIVDQEEVDLYDIRSRLIDLLWQERDRSGGHVDLRALVRVATSPTQPGRTFRRTLMNGLARHDDLEQAQAAAGG